MLLITSHFVCNKEGLDYNDIDSVIAQVPETLWITAESCKSMHACFVHKSYPDLNINPKAAPVGGGGNVRIGAQGQECSIGGSLCGLEGCSAGGKGCVEKYEDVNHQIKKARVHGMCTQVTKNQIDAIVQQIKVMQENKETLIRVHGKEEYGSMIVDYELRQHLPKP